MVERGTKWAVSLSLFFRYFISDRMKIKRRGPSPKKRDHAWTEGEKGRIHRKMRRRRKGKSERDAEINLRQKIFPLRERM